MCRSSISTRHIPSRKFPNRKFPPKIISTRYHESVVRGPLYPPDRAPARAKENESSSACSQLPKSKASQASPCMQRVSCIKGVLLMAFSHRESLLTGGLRSSAVGNERAVEGAPRMDKLAHTAFQWWEKCRAIEDASGYRKTFRNRQLQGAQDLDPMLASRD